MLPTTTRPFTKADLERAIELLHKPVKHPKCVKMRTSFFEECKKHMKVYEHKPNDCYDLYFGLPIVLDDTIKKDFEIEYYKEEDDND